jgi:hypothetical protein
MESVLSSAKLCGEDYNKDVAGGLCSAAASVTLTSPNDREIPFNPRPFMQSVQRCFYNE